MQNSGSQRYSSPENYLNRIIDEMQKDQESDLLNPKQFEFILNSEDMYEDLYLNSAVDFVVESPHLTKNITSNKRNESAQNNFYYNEDLNQKVSFERCHHHSEHAIKAKSSSSKTGFNIIYTFYLEDLSNKLRMKSKTFLSVGIIHHVNSKSLFGYVQRNVLFNF